MSLENWKMEEELVASEYQSVEIFKEILVRDSGEILRESIL